MDRNSTLLIAGVAAAAIIVALLASIYITWGYMPYGWDPAQRRGITPPSWAPGACGWGMMMYMYEECVSMHGGAVGPSVTPSQEPTVSFTLRTRYDDGGFFFEGVRGGIGRKVNPTLNVGLGEYVEIRLINGDGVAHNLFVEGYGVATRIVESIGDEAALYFKADEPGIFTYYCSIPGHRESGMVGKIIISG